MKPKVFIINFNTVVLIFVSVFLSGCKDKDVTSAMELIVNKTTDPCNIDADWDKPFWQKVTPQKLAHHMGEKPQHFPEVLFKVAYNDNGLYVIFKVKDQYVKAVVEDRFQGSVCLDSCAEFFFTPSDDINDGYFNLEVNCSGKLLFHYQTARNENNIKIAPEDCEKVIVAHSMPDLITEEIQEPVTWTLEYFLPFEVIKKYLPDAHSPASGVKWKANFFKCADKTSHPHWLTWSKVDLPRPSFHEPEYFGTIVFE